MSGECSIGMSLAIRYIDCLDGTRAHAGPQPACAAITVTLATHRYVSVYLYMPRCGGPHKHISRCARMLQPVYPMLDTQPAVCLLAHARLWCTLPCAYAH